MENQIQQTVFAFLVCLFSLYLLWMGLTGNVVKTVEDSPLIPRWVYMFGDFGLLIMAVAYLVLSMTA